MGSQVEVHLDSDTFDESVLHPALTRMRWIEDRCSRFRPRSDISLLNSRGQWRVHPDIAGLIRRARAARDTSQGRFDPTLGAHMRAIGYRSSWPHMQIAGDAPSPGRRDVDVDKTHYVRLAGGAVLDLGGIAKGYAADQMLALLGEHGPAAVGLGGDWAVSGPLRDGGAWPLLLEGRTEPLGLAQGGVATSGVDRRRWQDADGMVRHHVLDPRTGISAATDLLRVSVAAPSAEEAEVRATDLLVAGMDAAHTRARQQGWDALLVGANGLTRATGAFT